MDYASHIWPIKVVPKHPDIKVGDVFTMEVPCDPVTGLFTSIEAGGVLAVRKFKVVGSNTPAQCSVRM